MGPLPILDALCSHQVLWVGQTQHLEPSGNERDCSRCDDCPRDVMIADFFEQRTSAGDLVCVLAVVLWEETLHVLDIWREGQCHVTRGWAARPGCPCLANRIMSYGMPGKGKAFCKEHVVSWFDKSHPRATIHTFIGIRALPLQVSANP